MRCGNAIVFLYFLEVLRQWNASPMSGKGIATALGFLITIITVDMLLALAVFVLVVSLSRYISLGSISAAVAVPLILIIRENIFHVDIQGYHIILPFVIAVALLVIYTHRSNVGRLLQGKENRISLKKQVNIIIANLIY